MSGLMHYSLQHQHQIDHANAFRECGFDTTPSPYVDTPGVHVISGPYFAYEQWKHATPLMIDRAFWDDPNSVSIFWLMPDGTRRYASGYEPRPAPELEPWQDGSDTALILADYKQDTTAIEVFAVDRFDCVTVRKHPAECTTDKSLHEALKAADVVIGHSSTSLFESVRRGKPTICTDPHNPIAPVCSSWVNAKLYRGDRSVWLHEMSYKQFTLDEIADGTAWRLLKDVL